MITYFHNGEGWFQENRSIWKRVRRWIIWFGGWERYDEQGRDSWRFRIRSSAPDSFLAQLPRWKSRRWIWMDPTPLSLFGHRFTLFGWGWQLRVKGGWMVFSRKRYSDGERKLYISHDGTPSRAHCWIWGTPADVKRAVAERQIDRELRKAQEVA